MYIPYDTIFRQLFVYLRYFLFNIYYYFITLCLFIRFIVII